MAEDVVTRAEHLREHSDFDGMHADLLAEVMQLREKLIDIYMDDGVDPYRNRNVMSIDERKRWYADPREFMRQKLFGGER